MSSNDVTDLLDRLAATAPEPCGDAVAEVHRRIRRPTRRLLPAAGAFATVVAVLVAVGLIVGRSPTPAAPTTMPDGAEALIAGRQFAELFLSHDHRTLQRYNADVAENSTGPFRTDFVTKQAEVTELLGRAQSVANGRVLTAAVRDVTPTSATVLVVADQTVRTGVSGNQPVVNRYRASETLRLVDGRWLVETFEPVVGDPAIDGGYDTGCPDSSASPERSELLRQTCAAVERLYSFDYRTLDADLAARRTVATPEYGVVLPRIPAPPRIDPQAWLDAPLEEARVAAAAVVSEDGRTADVLAFVNQTSALPAPAPGEYLPQPLYLPKRFRLVVSLHLVEDRWLVDGIRTL